MKNYFDIFRAFIVLILSFQLISCGTILYPERRGQTAGRLDVGVVILDAIGLLFFLIPGIIAFAIDFSTGAIYVPASKTAKDNHSRYKIVKFDPHHYTIASLEKTIQQQTNSDFHFSDKQLRYIKLKERKEIAMRFKQFEENSSQEP